MEYRIYLRGKDSDKFVLLDYEDYLNFKDVKLYLVKGYVKFHNPYNQKMETLHRRIIKAPKYKAVDHINHNTLDNRKENLRLCTTRQNNGNYQITARNKSGYKGVCFHKGVWQAAITQNRKSVYLGGYKTAEEAAVAYNKAAIDYFGEFANLNEVSNELD